VRIPRNALLAVLTVGLAGLTGCVTRTYTIQTEPEGAEVYVSGRHLGPSPVQQQFTFYGTRKVILRMKGYETKTAELRVRRPWHQRFPLDFAPEVLCPHEIRDDQTFSFTLDPSEIKTPEDLLSRASEERKALAEVTDAGVEVTPERRKKQGHGAFPYAARDRSWWRRR